MLNKPDLLFMVNIGLNTVIPTSTQEPIDVSEGDYLYARVRGEQ